MSNAKLDKLEALVDQIEDSMRLDSMVIEQNARNKWPKYDRDWRADTIYVVEGRVEPRLPGYMNKLWNNCKNLMKKRTFARYREMRGPIYSDNGIGYGNPPDLYQARRDRTRPLAPPPVKRVPQPDARVQRRTVLATGQQVPLKR